MFQTLRETQSYMFTCCVLFSLSKFKFSACFMIKLIHFLSRNHFSTYATVCLESGFCMSVVL